MSEDQEKDVNPQAQLVEVLLDLVAKGEVEGLALVAVCRGGQMRFGITSSPQAEFALLGGTELLQNKLVTMISKSLEPKGKG
jgi:hypothetical protein